MTDNLKDLEIMERLAHKNQQAIKMFYREYMEQPLPLIQY